MAKRRLSELQALAQNELLKDPVVGVGQEGGGRLVFLLEESSDRCSEKIRKWAMSHDARYVIRVAGPIRST